MAKTTKLEHGKYFHIYNRGNNGENLFLTNDNFFHFLQLHEKYIDPIAETIAFCLMPNHFHFLIRIKNINEIDCTQLPVPKKKVKNYDPDRGLDSDRVLKSAMVNEPVNAILKSPHLYFSDLFNAYCQYLNKDISRTGSLFQRPFKRIEVDSMNYMKQLIVYIHKNPVHHGFTDNMWHYPWSSYGTILSLSDTNIPTKKILGWFDDKAQFIEAHKAGLNHSPLNDRFLEG